MSLTIAADTAADQVRNDALARGRAFSVAHVMQTTGVSEDTAEVALADLVASGALTSVFSVRCPATGEQIEAHTDLTAVPYAQARIGTDGAMFLVGPTDVIVMYEPVSALNAVAA